MRLCEGRIEQLASDMDPGDMVAVLFAICDQYHEGDWEDFTQTRFYYDMIDLTQSNRKRGINRMKRIIRLDEAISSYDDEMMDPNL